MCFSSGSIPKKCDELESTLVIRSTYMVAMDDFNAKLDPGRKAGVRYIGRYGIGERDDRDDKMATVAKTNKLFVGNTRFRKKAGRRWT